MRIKETKRTHGKRLSVDRIFVAMLNNSMWYNNRIDTTLSKKLCILLRMNDDQIKCFKPAY